VYTISDLMERAKKDSFEADLCCNSICKKYLPIITAEVSYRFSQNRTRTPSPEGRPPVDPSNTPRRIEMNGGTMVSLVHVTN
jgi:hypothetical protein